MLVSSIDKAIGRKNEKGINFANLENPFFTSQEITYPRKITLINKTNRTSKSNMFTEVICIRKDLFMDNDAYLGNLKNNVSSRN